ncbi:Thymidylate kinase [Rhodotorula mucilaginosa]|uniref:Thymidylate kinase n=1 Tax=Rhodotorula mucilaginosa TaxID=5537 RepID=A0A9P6W0Z8_RHOMI|nr:Thymidylate kinase [Rhodotorula mucilaginosa]
MASTASASLPAEPAAPTPRRRGAFIVLEGLDRSGKSTQVEKLVATLQDRGIDAVTARFPGKMIDSYLSQKSDLDDRAIHLLFSANRWERATQILEDLNRGRTVVCDRYAFSGIAFSVIKGLSWSWCRAPDIGLPAPDLVLFLRVSSAVAEQRGGFGQERYEKREVQQKVAGAFKRLGETMPEGEWIEVDADQAMEDVHREIVSRVDTVLDSNKLDAPVQRLWEDEEGL